MQHFCKRRCLRAVKWLLDTWRTFAITDTNTNASTNTVAYAVAVRWVHM